MIDVSVLIITFNQEKFIAQAINSAVHQKVNFNYEIVVSDDCSSDSTLQVALELQNNFPNIIRIIERKENIGFHKNLIQSIQNCKGRYVAILEGDDYWILPNKLQNQFEYLEKNTNISISFHDVLMKLENDKSIPWKYHLPKIDAEFDQNALLRGNFIPTCSAVFRKECLKELPDWFYSLKFADWTLLVFLAGQGKIGYLNMLGGVYRIQENGSWAKKKLNYKVFAIIDFYEKLISDSRIPLVGKSSLQLFSNYCDFYSVFRTNKSNDSKLFRWFNTKDKNIFLRSLSKWIVTVLFFLYKVRSLFCRMVQR